MSKSWTIWSIDAEHNYRGLDVAEGASYTEKAARAQATGRNTSAVRNGMHKLVFIAVPAGAYPTREEADEILAARTPPVPEPQQKEARRQLKTQPLAMDWYGSLTLHKLIDDLTDEQLAFACGATSPERRARLRKALDGWD